MYHPESLFPGFGPQRFYFMRTTVEPESLHISKRSSVILHKPQPWRTPNWFSARDLKHYETNEWPLSRGCMNAVPNTRHWHPNQPALPHYFSFCNILYRRTQKPEVLTYILPFIFIFLNLECLLSWTIIIASFYIFKILLTYSVKALVVFNAFSYKLLIEWKLIGKGREDGCHHADS